MRLDSSLPESDRIPIVSDKETTAAAIVLARLLAVDEQTAEQAILHIVRRLQQEEGSEALVEIARRIRRHRARRKGIFPQPIFGEPPWEMLLALYMDFSHESPSIRKLANSVQLPPTTATRWLGYLEDHDLIRLKPNPADQRSIVVELTESARRSLEEYLAGIELG